MSPVEGSEAHISATANRSDLRYRTGDRELATENLDAGGPAYDYCVLRHRYVHDAFADAVRAVRDSGDLRPGASTWSAGQIFAFMDGHVAARGRRSEGGPPLPTCSRELPTAPSGTTAPR